MADATTGQPAGAPTTDGSPTPPARQVPDERTASEQPASGAATGGSPGGSGGIGGSPGQGSGGSSRRRRGSRGGRGRTRTAAATAAPPSATAAATGGGVPAPPTGDAPPLPAVGAPAPRTEVPAAPSGPPPARPKIGDRRPAPTPVAPPEPAGASRPAGAGRGRSRAGGGPRGATEGDARPPAPKAAPARGEGRKAGRERRGKAVGRYMIAVHVREDATQIALLEGRTLVEHYVSRASDDATQIDGNIYRGRVQNVLPGMEAAFVDIGTPKNAVLYHGDVRYDTDDVESGSGPGQPRIEQLLRAGQTVLVQVTKNPIGAKGARLTQEVSLPGRFVVLVPNSTAYGISKRLDDAERKRLRRIVDAVRPDGHGLIVRTAAAGASAEELERDVTRLVGEWEKIDVASRKGQGPALLYREPDIALRVIREELNREYRAVVIDDRDLFEEVQGYVRAVNPELAERVEFFDPEFEPLPIFERFHVHEQLHKALDRKVYLPSGGSLVIDRTEALTVIDVNTGKNVGKSNLEETVYRNNLEAAEEVARQLRLRDIGGIIVIDFIDMEIRENRDKVGSALRTALARDKTRTQVFDISELGLVEMTRKRVSEGLIESLSTTCEVCGGRGILIDDPEL